MNTRTDSVGGVGGHRYKGYEKAMLEAGLEINPDLVFHVQIKEKNKLHNFEEIYRQKDNMTAIDFCYDFHAMEAMGYLRQKGVRFPQDLSIIGFDDIDMSRLTYPRLTTVHQGIKEKGRMAAKQLIQLLKGIELESNDVKLPTYLVERESIIEI